MGVNFSLAVGGFTVFTAVVARMGEVELAANQIAFKLVSMSFLPGHGIGEAAGVLTGQYLGARNLDAVRRAYRNATLLAIAVMSVMGVGFVVFAGQLGALFTDDPRVLAVTAQLLMVAALFQLFDAIEMTATGALNGVGDTRFTMWLSIAGAWLLLVPLSVLFGLVLNLGAVGAWLALTVEIAVMSVLAMKRFKAEPW
jgi:MATE family multidrug resistance protein